MCKFCDRLDWREYCVPERNRMDRDNLCEILTERLGDEVNLGNELWCNDCLGCMGQNTHFVLNARENQFSLSYRFKGRDLQIDRNSEMVTFNFCPWCGKRLPGEMVDFEKSIKTYGFGPVLMKG